jgi:malate synthase
MNYRKILENYIYGNKDTMKEQLVEAIKHILDENNELKAALKINHDLYESKCNQNTKLEEENKELQKSVDQIYDDYQDIGKMYFNLTEKIENKIEEWNKERHIAGEHLVVQVLQDILGEE